jgi:F0F1-type ATP synthase epsilon subunit
MNKSLPNTRTLSAEGMAMVQAMGADRQSIEDEAARIRAKERLQHKQSMHEYYQSKIALNRAMQRLQATAKYNR